MVVTPHLRGRWKLVPAALVIVVAIGRMYVGAHLPLDLIGGAALGASAGAFANLIVGHTSAANDRPRETTRPIVTFGPVAVRTSAGEW
jgi:undecaprenyl-diphosphatase